MDDIGRVQTFSAVNYYGGLVSATHFVAEKVRRAGSELYQVRSVVAGQPVVLASKFSHHLQSRLREIG